MLNFTVIIGVIGTGLVVWKVAIVGSVIAYIGGIVGGRIATKKGNKFVLNVMLGLMIISGIALLVS